jgi:hypothetical protein
MYRHLNAGHIVQTIGQLRERIDARFPGSGLGKVATELHQVANEAVARAGWIAKPHLGLRLGIGFMVALIVVVAAMAAVSLQLPIRLQSFTELIQAIESGVNDLVFLALALFFLVTIEVRIKRRRALKAIHELRSIAHIIDMHQLTKDPHVVLNPGAATPPSPKRTLTPFELCRYLDYCSEMLSLIGKLAALYGERFDDSVALNAVDQIEDLTTGLSRKIWQKIALVSGQTQPLPD